MAFNQVLTASWFKYGALPFIATGLALLIKFNSRPDTKRSAREDWAVGFDLCQVSVFAILGDGVADAVQDLSNKGLNKNVTARLADLPWILFGMLGILILVSYIVRKAGWKAAGSGAAPELNAFGVILPLLIGVVYVICAIMWMGGKVVKKIVSSDWLWKTAVGMVVVLVLILLKRISSPLDIRSFELLRDLLTGVAGVTCAIFAGFGIRELLHAVQNRSALKPRNDERQRQP